MYSGEAVGSVKAASGCGACGPAVQDLSRCSEYGSEWTYDGYGSCGDCSFNCVDLGLLGKACTAGTNARCKKTYYSGDKYQCCFGKQPDGYPYKTCDPSYSITSSACSDTLYSYCAEGKNIFIDKTCQTWADAYPDRAMQIKQRFCGGLNGAWDINCLYESTKPNAQGKLDNYIIPFCQKNPGYNVCTCVMSEMDCPNKFDKNCIQKGGYKDHNMTNAKCPDIMNCTQFVSLSPGAKAIATNVQQNCEVQKTEQTVVKTEGKTEGKPDTVTETKQPEVTVKNNETTLNTSNVNMKLLLFIVLLIIIVLAVAIGGVVYYNRKSASRQLK